MEVHTRDGPVGESGSLLGTGKDEINEPRKPDGITLGLWSVELCRKLAHSLEDDDSRGLPPNGREFIKPLGEEDGSKVRDAVETVVLADEPLAFEPVEDGFPCGGVGEVQEVEVRRRIEEPHYVVRGEVIECDACEEIGLTFGEDLPKLVLSLPQSQTALRTSFSRDKDMRDSWLAITGKANPGLSSTALEDKAWAACFNDFKDWYEKKLSILDGMRRFHQGLRIRTDLIDVVERGHWKVNFIHKWVEEKGLDTALAVDMIALQDIYDVAVIVSGDADMIPSIDHLKRRGKHIGALEFMSGTPPESKGRTFSSRLKEHADFVIRIYETELVRHRIVTSASKMITY